MDESQNEKKSKSAYKAWRVEVKYFNKPFTIIRSHTTRNKARYQEYRLGRSRGYIVGFNHIRVTRASEFDHLANKSSMLGGTQEGVTWGCLA